MWVIWEALGVRSYESWWEMILLNDEEITHSYFFLFWLSNLTFVHWRILQLIEDQLYIDHYCHILYRNSPKLPRKFIEFLRIKQTVDSHLKFLRSFIFSSINHRKSNISKKCFRSKFISILWNVINQWEMNWR